ncbi:PREDICTED: crooked neck-like protein 1 [Rhagoletis zephyria]|uniref:crooked neck-like protein 1 n=1 Tax=Rhagoletis zephyria TaxID=28612 RepID=UPI0008114E2C|nr:PREDICTED: crooked neck-like protein 1 [Rhagoletis zephyria]KAH9406615.1 Crooked neck-like protein 1 [Tyrophagus putrescentiae]
MNKGKAAKTKVKNKAPAEVQITAEQLLREAKERELEIVAPPPKQKISDPDELADYQLRKRKAFEDGIRKSRTSFANWVKYAKWEESQQEIQRARSIYERALDVDYRNIKIWLKYSQMEMRNRQINHARNVLDRAVLILPRVNQFWYKYIYMEEMLNNIPGCRQVFERWMDWEPNEQAWFTYIKFELRYDEIDRARAIYSRFVTVHPEVRNWIKFAHFEEQHGFIENARDVYEKAIEFFGDDHLDERLFMSFAKFEENQHEYDRVRVIYKYALEKLSVEDRQELFKQYSLYEKKHGNRFEIEDVIFSKRKAKYESELKANSHDYDVWFDYIRLMENEGDIDKTRDVYERAVSNVPLGKEKRLWRRYIYLWVYYAVFEELTTKDYDRTREVYNFMLKLIPHKSFTFAKLWVMAAKFEVRQKNLTAARKLFGTAIGLCPKEKLFKEYIEFEIQLREFDRCRIIYQKYLEYAPQNCMAWMKFAELENILGEVERGRSIFEIAIDQPRLDMPELIWKAYIDFEIELENFDKARLLYERLLERTEHVKVWISFARFELIANKEDAQFGIQQARSVFERANKALKDCVEKESRLMLLEAWLEFEVEQGDEKSLAAVRKQMPKKVKKRRKIKTDDGSDAGWEEYFDYIFPDKEAQPHLKFLEAAKMWKQKKEMGTATAGPSTSGSAD